MSKFTLVPQGTRVTDTGVVGRTQGTPKETQLSLHLVVTGRDEDVASSIDVKVQHLIGNASDDAGAKWKDLVSFTQVTGETADEIKTVTTPFGDKIRVHATPAGDDANVTAAYTTSLTGTQNDLVYTADIASTPAIAGAVGNGVSVKYLDPGVNNGLLSVAVSGYDIVVSLATNGSGVITSTAAQVKAAIEAFPAAEDLVNIANAGGNDGTGVVTALAKTNLAGGVTGDAAFTLGVYGVAK